MNQLLCWVAFPLVLALLSLGCGLLLERATGVRLAEPLLLPAGLAVIVIAAELMTKLDATARFTTPAVVVLALVGFALGRPWETRPRIGGWPLLAAAAVYLVYLAPVLLTGEPTFTGYIKLDDTATWMAMTDQVFSHGRNISNLAPSTYSTALQFYLHGGEPVGSFLPWGIGHQLVGEDLAWVFQPYLAFLGAMLALSAWPIAGSLIRSRPLRALVVFIAAQSALTYGYSLWGGVKEMAAAAFLPLIAACAVTVFRAEARIRSFLPLAAASFAMLSVLAYGGAVWIAVALAIVGLGALRIWARRATRPQLAGLAAVAVVLALGLIHGAQGFVNGNGSLTSTQFGNLLHPLNWLQLFGIWPAGDFRFEPPDAPTVTHLLIVLVALAGCLALAESWSRRRWALSLYLLSAIVGALLVYWKGSPWVVGKALATASPAVLLVGVAGAAGLIDGGARLPWEGGSHAKRLVSARRAGGALLLAAISAGVLWSNVLAYGHVTIAPYATFRQLEQIGDRFAGDGPTLINEYSPYGARHFLRAMVPESPSELRRHVIPLLDGRQLSKEGYADLDQFQLPGILFYRTIVERTSPTASRPPTPYQLVFNGQWYQVWQRPLKMPRQVLAHLGLGDSIDPTAIPSCSQVLALARSAQSTGGVLAAVARPSTGADVVPATLPNGTTAASFTVGMPGLYELWLGGTFWRRLTAYVDGVRIGSIRGQINEAGGYTPLGTIRLKPGAARVDLVYGGAQLDPGGAGPGPAGPFFSVGPLILSPVLGSLPVTYVPPTDARSLCGRPWDWIEALGS